MTLELTCVKLKRGYSVVWSHRTCKVNLPMKLKSQRTRESQMNTRGPSKCPKVSAAKAAVHTEVVWVYWTNLYVALGSYWCRIA